MNTRKALLIVDMSHDFVADEGGLTVGKPAQDLVTFIIEKADEFVSNGEVVVITMDEHEPKDPHFERWPIHNVKNTKGAEPYGELKTWYEQNKVNPNVLYVPKTNYNAFHETNLAQTLRAKDVTKVYVTGVCTDICDFLTLAGADAHGFDTAVYRQGVATFTPNQDLFLTHANACFKTEIIE